jgi:hypothetical protein
MADERTGGPRGGNAQGWRERPAVKGLASLALALTRLRPERMEELEEFRERGAKARELDSSSVARTAWARLGRLRISDAFYFARFLPDPLRRRGRPPGSGSAEKAAEREAVLRAIDECVAKGLQPTTAAKMALKERGCPPEQLKNRADYHVTCWRAGERNRIDRI